MRVLFLGAEDSPVAAWLKVVGEEVSTTMEKVDISLVHEISPEFIVSYGYRYVVGKDILDAYINRAVNLHISYLPWNRGADPNLWSFVDGTPKGVTIHYLDTGIDTGDIIAQKEVFFPIDERITLQTTYLRLQQEIELLFQKHWSAIRSRRCGRVKQGTAGTFHRLRDRVLVEHLLTAGWDTPVIRLSSAVAT